MQVKSAKENHYCLWTFINIFCTTMQATLVLKVLRSFHLHLSRAEDVDYSGCTSEPKFGHLLMSGMACWMHFCIQLVRSSVLNPPQETRAGSVVSGAWKQGNLLHPILHYVLKLQTPLSHGQVLHSSKRIATKHLHADVLTEVSRWCKWTRRIAVTHCQQCNFQPKITHDLSQ